MVRCTLGRTGIELSRIGYGAFKIGRNQQIKYARGYELPSDNEVDTLIGSVLDLGINYIDTAPAYGSSEARLGQSLQRLGRSDDVIISTKVGETFEHGRSRFDYSQAAVQSSVQRSCGLLNRDVLDLVFVHSDGHDLHILNATPVIQTLKDLKQRGVIRAIGFSGKTVAGAQAALPLVDALMVEYHLEDRSHEDLITTAAAMNVGIIVKKPLASGRLPAEEAIGFVLRNPGVTSMVIGGLNIQHVRENVASGLA